MSYRMIPAYHFKSRSAGDGVIEDYVNDILRVIEDDMKQAIDNDLTRSRTEVSIYYEVPGMDNARAKKHIFFHTLRALRKAGYIPTLEEIAGPKNSPRAYIYVTWMTKEDTDYEEYMDRFIKAHSTKKPTSQPEDKVTKRRAKKWA
jgi:hypothetical protein